MINNKKDWKRGGGLCGGYIYIQFILNGNVEKIRGFSSWKSANKAIKFWMEG